MSAKNKELMLLTFFWIKTITLHFKIKKGEAPAFLNDQTYLK